MKIQSHTLLGRSKTATQFPDGPRYKAIGNGVISAGISLVICGKTYGDPNGRIPARYYLFDLEKGNARLESWLCAPAQFMLPGSDCRRRSCGCF